MKKHIPNTITMLNLLSGSFAILFAMQGNVKGTFILLAAALVFDFMDGLAARALKAYSELGKQLDSLADLVSFGVAPAFLVRAMMINLVPVEGDTALRVILINIPFILVAATAYRLARFNIDADQAEVFKGLPAPANALFWVSFMYFIQANAMDSKNTLYLVLAAVVLLSYQLVSTLPMFSLKFKHLKWKDNEVRYSFLILSVLLFIMLKLSGFFVVIWLYILFSMVQKTLVKK